MAMDSSRDASGAEIYRLAKLHNAPDFVKAASTEELRPTKPLLPMFYGDPRSGTYPLHTKAATWYSYGFFLENKKRGIYKKADADVIAERILHSAKVHGISKTCAELATSIEKSASVTDDDLPDHMFGIVWSNGDGSKERHLRMANAVETRKAAEFLIKHRDTFPFDHRRELAERILEKVAEYGASVGPMTQDLEKQAGLGHCTSSDACDLIASRVHVSRKGPGPLSSDQSDMLKLAQLIQDRPSAIRDQDIRVKVARIVDAFDRRHALVSAVRDGKLSRPEDIIFGVTREKLASAVSDHTGTITGNLYKLADVEKLSMRVVSDVLGADIADAMSANGISLSGEKAAEVIPTLPRNDAELFDKLMEARGLQPAAKQASAHAVRLERNLLLEAASRR